MLNILGQKLGELAVLLHVLSVAIAAPQGTILYPAPQSTVPYPAPAVYDITPTTLSTGEFSGVATTTQKETEKPVWGDIAPKIAFCESGGKHYGEDGAVIRNSNKNGTTDWGMYQINSTHIPFAQKIGLDISNPEDNEILAGLLYDRFGPEIWYGYDIEKSKCSWEK